MDSPPPTRPAGVLRSRVLVMLRALAVAGVGAGLLAGPVGPGGDARRVATAAGPPASVDPAGVSVERGVRYGSSPAMVLDVHRRRQPGPRAQPAVLVVHGGGWAGGDKRRMAGVASTLATAGFVAVNVNYSLAFPWRPGFPTQLTELRRAVRWTRRNADRLGADPTRIGALGSSAGGHLAALLAVRSRGSPGRGDRVAAVASWSGPLRLAQAGELSLATAIHTFLGCRSRACPRRDAAASPTSHVTPDDPPMLIVHSRHDEVVPVEHAHAMAARLSRAGVAHRLWVMPGRDHGMVYAATALGPSIEFLRRRLR